MRTHRLFLGFATAWVASPFRVPLPRKSIGERGNNKGLARPIVWRLCGSQIPDVERIVACLRRNTPQLSDRCRAVFAQGDNAPARPEDRTYGQRRYERDYEQRGYDRGYGPRRYDRDYGPRGYGREYGPRPYDYDDE
jgi:hypothetical protein